MHDAGIGKELQVVAQPRVAGSEPGVGGSGEHEGSCEGQAGGDQYASACCWHRHPLRSGSQWLKLSLSAGSDCEKRAAF